MSTTPSRCRGGCGFFGNPATGQFCSKCWKEFQKSHKEEAAAMIANASASRSTAPPAPVARLPSTVAQPDSSLSSPPSSPRPMVSTPTASPLSVTPDSPPPRTSVVAYSSLSPPSAARATASSPSTPSSNPAGAAIGVSVESPPSFTPAANDTDRCAFCKKRMGLMAFPCVCGYSFCTKHRHPDSHECAANLAAKQAAKNRLTQALPALNASKIDRL